MRATVIRALPLWGGATLLALLVLLSSTGPAGLVVGVAAALGFAVVAAIGAEKAGTALMALALLLAPMNDIRPVASADFVTFSDLTFLLGFILLAPQVGSGKAQVPTLFVVGSALLVAAGVLASVLSLAPVLSLIYFARMIAAVMVLPVLIAMWGPSRQVLRLLAWAYVLGQIVSTAAGLLQGPVNSRYLGLTTHPNFYGMCAAIASALVLYLFHHSRGRERILVVGAGAICLWSVFMSGSRASALAAILVALAYPVIERSVRAGYALLVGGVAVLVLVIVVLPGAGQDTPLSRLQGNESTRGSDNERSQLLSEGWSDFLESPITGDGFSYEVTLVHNGYVEVGIATGIFGLLGYLLLLWSLTRPVLRARFPNRMGYVALTYMLILPFNNTLWDRFSWAALALIFAAERLERKAEEDAAPALPPPPAASRSLTPAAARNAGRAR
jgi:O-antigen ligase